MPPSAPWWICARTRTRPTPFYGPPSGAPDYGFLAKQPCGNDEEAVVSFARSVTQEVALLRWPLLRTLLTATLFLICVTEYPFHPTRIFTTFAVAVLVVAVLLCVWVYTQLERDPVLRRISGAEKSWMGADQLLRLLAWIAIPLVIALNSYFPSLAYDIQQWVSLNFPGAKGP